MRSKEASMKYSDLISFKLDAADFRIRRQDWSGILIHHTGLPDSPMEDEKDWNEWYQRINKYLSKRDENYVSSHFVIGYDGRISQLVDPEQYVAFHAGKSCWWDAVNGVLTKSCNDSMIGIELIGDGNLESFTDKQYKSLADLTKALIAQFKTIHPTCIVGHSMVSPGRKIDPGSNFDWKRYFQMIYGGAE